MHEAWYAVTVDVTPSATGMIVKGGGGIANDGTGQAILDQGDVLIVLSAAGGGGPDISDLTGTHVEADMLAWFQTRYGALPWFNRQRERSKEEHYDYAPEAKQKLRKGYMTGTGNRFSWAIAPTKSNPHHKAFSQGHLLE